MEKDNSDKSKVRELMKDPKTLIRTIWAFIKDHYGNIVASFSLLVAVATLLYTCGIDKTANTINKKTQEITYSFSEDSLNNSSISILKKEFEEYFKDQNITIDLDLEKTDDGKSEMQTVQIIDDENDEIDKVGVLLSLYPESNEICGDITGIIVSKKTCINEKTDDTIQFINSEYFNINAPHNKTYNGHDFIIDDIGVYMVLPPKGDHISFLIAKQYMQTEDETEDLIYVTLKGYSGSLKQFAIRVITKNENASFNVIDKKDIYDFDKVKSFLTEEYGMNSVNSKQITNHDVIAQSEQMDEDFNAIANKYNG